MCPTFDIKSLTNDGQHQITHKKILVVACDLPSHPYAAAKLAKVLARQGGHSVVLAAPQGPAYQRIVQETTPTNNNNNQRTLSTGQLQCMTLGSVATKKHVNERTVANPNAWGTLWSALREPYPIANALNNMGDLQDNVYKACRREIIRAIEADCPYDLVIPMHSILHTICDAVESAVAELKTRKVAFPEPAILIFSSLPYDPAMFMGEQKAWYMPRPLTNFLHVSAYPVGAATNDNQTSVKTGTTMGRVTLFVESCRTLATNISRTSWKLLDAALTAWAWHRSAAYNNRRRRRRGLNPIPDGARGYLQKYPVVSFGGVYPYMDKEVTVLADHVTCLGSLDDSPIPLDANLQAWLDRQTHGIVYASFGTGTELNETEISALTGRLARSLLQPVDGTTYSTLISLRPTEQRRLRRAMDAAVGSSPSAESETHLEYLNGRLRIQADVSQSTLLQKPNVVKVFLSHMGMGGFVEGCKGGVPFVAYPSGCDQFFNAQRAIEAGIARQAAHELVDIVNLVQQTLADKEMQQRAKDIAKELSKVTGEERLLSIVADLTSAKAPKKNSTGASAEANNEATKLLQNDSLRAGLRRRPKAVTIPAQAA